MDKFKVSDIKDIHVGHIPAAKLGVIDSLIGRDENKAKVEEKHLNSYTQGHELGTEIENLLKGEQRDY